MIRMPRWLAPLAFALTTLDTMPAARAEAPQVLTQVPGYYRQTIGAFEVTALYDGQINLDTKLLLVDTGAAKVFGPTVGHVPANLKAAGYEPADA